jgi:dipeptidase
VSQLALLYWQPMSQGITKVWSEIENKVFADQAQIEEEALRLYKEDPVKARQFLTEYCVKTADDAVTTYWKLGDDLWSSFTRYF